jgi:hypothetical protein
MRGGKSPSGEDAGGEGVRQILILVRSWVHGNARSSGHMEPEALCYIGPYGKKVAARSFAHAHQVAVLACALLLRSVPSAAGGW